MTLLVGNIVAVAELARLALYTGKHASRDTPLSPLPHGHGSSTRVIASWVVAGKNKDTKMNKTKYLPSSRAFNTHVPLYARQHRRIHDMCTHIAVFGTKCAIVALARRSGPDFEATTQKAPTLERRLWHGRVRRKGDSGVDGVELLAS